VNVRRGEMCRDPLDWVRVGSDSSLYPHGHHWLDTPQEPLKTMFLPAHNHRLSTHSGTLLQRHLL
jgi:hypothetical protein